MFGDVEQKIVARDKMLSGIAEMIESGIPADEILALAKTAVGKDEEIDGKIYEFNFGEIYDELVEDCRKLVEKYYRYQVEDEEIAKNTIGYQIGKGNRKIDDELLFQSAISHYREYLMKQIRERESHIIWV